MVASVSGEADVGGRGGLLGGEELGFLRRPDVPPLRIGLAVAGHGTGSADVGRPVEPDQVRQEWPDDARSAAAAVQDQRATGLDDDVGARGIGSPFPSGRSSRLAAGDALEDVMDDDRRCVGE